MVGVTGLLSDFLIPHFKLSHYRIRLAAPDAPRQKGRSKNAPAWWPRGAGALYGMCKASFSLAGIDVSRCQGRRQDSLQGCLRCRQGPGGKCLRSSSGTARGRAPEKSRVVPSRGSVSVFICSGQSAALMSQKRHCCLLGTRAVGLSAASLRINAPRFCMNWSSTASAGMRTVWSW